MPAAPRPGGLPPGSVRWRHTLFSARRPGRPSPARRRPFPDPAPAASRPATQAGSSSAGRRCPRPPPWPADGRGGCAPAHGPECRPAPARTDLQAGRCAAAPAPEQTGSPALTPHTRPVPFGRPSAAAGQASERRAPSTPAAAPRPPPRPAPRSAVPAAPGLRWPSGLPPAADG